MKPLFIYYPKCSTCQKAQKWLNEHHIEVEVRDIVKNNPTKSEIEVWTKQCNISVSKLFNTSGLVYKALGLKEKIKTASTDELIDYLASDGKLIKRPVLVLPNHKVLLGFKEQEWQETLL